MVFTSSFKLRRNTTEFSACNSILQSEAKIPNKSAFRLLFCQKQHSNIAEMAPGQQIGTRNTTLTLGGPAHGIVTKTLHKTLSGLLFCLFKTEPCAVVSLHMSCKFTGEVAITSFTWFHLYF